MVHGPAALAVTGCRSLSCAGNTGSCPVAEWDRLGHGNRFLMAGGLAGVSLQPNSSAGRLMEQGAWWGALAWHRVAWVVRADLEGELEGVGAGLEVALPLVQHRVQLPPERRHLGPDGGCLLLRERRSWAPDHHRLQPRQRVEPAGEGWTTWHKPLGRGFKPSQTNTAGHPCP